MLTRPSPLYFASFILALSFVVGAAPTKSRAQQSTTGASTSSTEQVANPAWPTHLTLGFGAGVDINSPSSKDYVLDGITVNSGSTTVGPEFHLLLELPIATNLMFAPRLAFNSIGVQWTNGTGTLSATAPGSDSKNIATSVSTLGANLLFKYSFSGLHVMLGPAFSTSLSPTYSHATTVGTPNAALPSASGLLAAIQAGVGYDIPLNATNTIWLTPEVFYHFMLSDIATKTTSPASEYLSSTIQAGLSLKFDMSPAQAKPKEVAQVEASISARGVLPDNSPTAEPIVPTQALHTRSSMPLLPYVFFNENEASIPNRYTRMGTTGFTTESLKGKTELDATHSVLDILGMRMKQNPGTTITLTGTNANSGLEKNNIKLSKARAMAVKDYLVNTWGIDGSRITVDQRNLPELATNPVTKAGKEENRRVEISSSDARMTEPVKLESRDNVTVGETTVRFETNYKPSDTQFKDWSIMLDDNGKQIGNTLSGNGAPPPTSTMVITDASSYVGHPIHFKMTLNTTDGRQVTADGMTRVVTKPIDRENLERYGMLSFDFNTSEINPRAKQMLELIGESISRDANGVTVTGFCDSTGSAEYNQALSEQRATSALTVLRNMTKLPGNTGATGEGIRDPKFVNDLPEGRQLNRRVEVTIQKSSK